MKLRRSAAVVLRHFYLVRGSLSRVFPLFVWVGIDIVLWGFISRYLDAVSRAGLDFVATLLGAVLLWNFLTRVMQGVTMAFFEEVWSRNFLNLFAAPLSIAEYLTGLVLSSIATSAIGLIVMLIVAISAFGLPVALFGAAAIPLMLVLFIFGVALGIFGISLVMRLGPAAEWFVWPIPAVLSPFAGVFYPVATLPGWMQVVAYLMPPAYVFDGVRGVATDGRLDAAALFPGAGLAICYLLLACWTFWRVFRYAVRTGLIARYSAESVT